MKKMKKCENCGNLHDLKNCSKCGSEKSLPFQDESIKKKKDVYVNKPFPHIVKK